MSVTISGLVNIAGRANFSKYTGPIISGLYLFEGNYNDSSSAGRNLTPGSGVSVSTVMNCATHAALGATSSSALALAGNFTIELWGTASSFTSTLNTLWATRASAGDSAGLDFGINNTGTRFLIQNGSTSLVNAVISLSTGVANHFAIERVGSTITAYLNGTSVGSATYTGTVNSVFRVGALRFVASIPTNSRSWIGDLDDLRITTNAARYGENFTPPAPF